MKILPEGDAGGLRDVGQPRRPGRLLQHLHRQLPVAGHRGDGGDHPRHAPGRGRRGAGLGRDRARHAAHPDAQPAWPRSSRRRSCSPCSPWRPSAGVLVDRRARRRRLRRRPASSRRRSSSGCSAAPSPASRRSWRRSRSAAATAAGVAAGVLLLMYLMNIVAELQVDLAWLADFGAFKYLLMTELIDTGVVPWSSIAVFGVVAVGGLAGRAPRLPAAGPPGVAGHRRPRRRRSSAAAEVAGSARSPYTPHSRPARPDAALCHPRPHPAASPAAPAPARHGPTRRPMYAVIETGGKQYRVEVGTELAVELLEVERARRSRWSACSSWRTATRRRSAARSSTARRSARPSCATTAPTRSSRSSTSPRRAAGSRRATARSRRSSGSPT